MTRARWLMLALAGCAQPVVLSTPSSYVPKPAHAVAVYPFQVRSEKTAEHAIALGTRLAERVAQTQQYAVFGPADFHILNPDGDAILVLTDLATAVPSAGVPVDGLVVLRGWVERRVQSSSGAEQVTTFAHLELVEAVSGQAIASVEESKPGDVKSEEALDQLTPRMLSALATQAPGERIERHAWWASADVDAAGLRVHAPSAQATGLREGEVVTRVGGMPATALAVARVLRLASEGDHVPVAVHRPEGEATLQLPVAR